MPSSEVIEIDISNNDVAMIDATSCGVIVTSSQSENERETAPHPVSVYDSTLAPPSSAAKTYLSNASNRTPEKEDEKNNTRNENSKGKKERISTKRRSKRNSSPSPARGDRLNSKSRISPKMSGKTISPRSMTKQLTKPKEVLLKQTAIIEVPNPPSEDDSEAKIIDTSSGNPHVSSDERSENDSVVKSEKNGSKAENNPKLTLDAFFTKTKRKVCSSGPKDAGADKKRTSREDTEHKRTVDPKVSNRPSCGGNRETDSMRGKLENLPPNNVSSNVGCVEQALPSSTSEGKSGENITLMNGNTFHKETEVIRRMPPINANDKKLSVGPELSRSLTGVNKNDDVMKNFILTPKDNDDTFSWKCIGNSTVDVVAFASRTISASPRRVLTSKFCKINPTSDEKENYKQLTSRPVIPGHASDKKQAKSEIVSDTVVFVEGVASGFCHDAQSQTPLGDTPVLSPSVVAANIAIANTNGVNANFVNLVEDEVPGLVGFNQTIVSTEGYTIGGPGQASATNIGNESEMKSRNCVLEESNREKCGQSGSLNGKKSSEGTTRDPVEGKAFEIEASVTLPCNPDPESKKEDCSSDNLCSNIAKSEPSPRKRRQPKTARLKSDMKSRIHKVRSATKHALTHKEVGCSLTTLDNLETSPPNLDSLSSPKNQKLDSNDEAENSSTPSSLALDTVVTTGNSGAETLNEKISTNSPKLVEKVRCVTKHALASRQACRSSSPLTPRNKSEGSSLDPDTISQQMNLTPQFDNEEELPVSSPDTSRGLAETQKKTDNSGINLSISESTSPICPHAEISEENCKLDKQQEGARAISDVASSNSTRLGNYQALREKHVTRAFELETRPSRADFEEEQLCLEDIDMPAIQPRSIETNGDFPDRLIPCLSVLVQGSSLPLSALARRALDELSVYATDPDSMTLDSISSKIKLLAKRKQYLTGHPQTHSKACSSSPKPDCFEDTNEEYLWRWELTSTDLLSKREIAKVKKARSNRKRLQGHHKAITRLISSLDEACTWLSRYPTDPPPATLVAKVSGMEEKVLKFEREEEMARLLKETKLEKEKAKAEMLAVKQEEKERTEQHRRNERKRKEDEKKRKKLEAAKERKDAKRRKIEEKEKEKLNHLKEKEEKEKKQKALMLSFFSKPEKKKKLNNLKNSSNRMFDSESFRDMIDSQDEHVRDHIIKLSRRSIESRRRKTQKVNISVFVTVLSDNPFDPQPYDDVKVISVPNKYKFLGFHEDHRPPYHGTWSKPRSTIVNGRNPFRKDTQFLDYEVDSEAEWEEEDDLQGEDCDDDGADEEEDKLEEGDSTAYNYDDGWMAQDDDLGIEDEDEESRELRKRNIQHEVVSDIQPALFAACAVAPLMGGLPHVSSDSMDCLVDGFSPEAALAVVSSHLNCILDPSIKISLDAFPPLECRDGVDQNGKETLGEACAQNGPKNCTAQALSPEAAKTVAKFVHNSTLKSRDKVVTELLKLYPSITTSRAQAFRELDAMAEKRRLPNGGGFVWEVKKDCLNALGLKGQHLNPPPITSTVSPAPGNSSPSEVLEESDSSPIKKRARPHNLAASGKLIAAFLKKKQRRTV